MTYDATVVEQDFFVCYIYEGCPVDIPYIGN